MTQLYIEHTDHRRKIPTYLITRRAHAVHIGLPLCRTAAQHARRALAEAAIRGQRIDARIGAEAEIRVAGGVAVHDGVDLLLQRGAVGAARRSAARIGDGAGRAGGVDDPRRAAREPCEAAVVDPAVGCGRGRRAGRGFYSDAGLQVGAGAGADGDARVEEALA